MQVSFPELCEKLLSKLGYLWLNNYSAVRLAWTMEKVLLVILFGRIERFEGCDLRYDRYIPDFFGLKLCNDFFSNFCLFRRVIEDR